MIKEIVEETEEVRTEPITKSEFFSKTKNKQSMQYNWAQWWEYTDNDGMQENWN